MSFDYSDNDDFLLESDTSYSDIDTDIDNTDIDVSDISDNEDVDTYTEEETQVVPRSTMADTNLSLRELMMQNPRRRAEFEMREREMKAQREKEESDMRLIEASSTALKNVERDFNNNMRDLKKYLDDKLKDANVLNGKIKAKAIVQPIFNNFVLRFVKLYEDYIHILDDVQTKLDNNVRNTLDKGGNYDEKYKKIINEASMLIYAAAESSVGFSHKDIVEYIRKSLDKLEELGGPHIEVEIDIDIATIMTTFYNLVEEYTNFGFDQARATAQAEEITGYTIDEIMELSEM